MEWMYKGPNKLRKALNEYAASALTAYVLTMNSYNLVFKTGHPSIDLATGRSQPTALEQIVMDIVK